MDSLLRSCSRKYGSKVTHFSDVLHNVPPILSVLCRLFCFFQAHASEDSRLIYPSPFSFPFSLNYWFLNAVSIPCDDMAKNLKIFCLLMFDSRLFSKLRIKALPGLYFENIHLFYVCCLECPCSRFITLPRVLASWIALIYCCEICGHPPRLE